MLRLAAAALAAGAAVQPVADAQPRTVRLDAVVRDADGRSVEDLVESDFQVLQGGDLLAVDEAQFVRAGDKPLRFALFLDEYHVSAGPAAERARLAAARFVSQLDPRDLLVVFKPLDQLTRIALTTDRGQALAAIATLDGRLGDYAPRTAFERSYIAQEPSQVDAARAQISTSALDALARHLGRLPGTRKTLLVVSEGFPQPPHGRDALPTIGSVARTANRSNVAIHLFNPRETDWPADAPGPRVERATTLEALADRTGGYVMRPGRHLGVALGRLVADARAHYVVTFQGTGSTIDGRLGPLELRVGRPGLDVHARRELYRTPPAEALRPATTVSPASRIPDLPRRTSRLIRPWFGLSRGRAGLTRVKIAWEPARRTGGAAGGGLAPTQVAVQAWTADGEQVFQGLVRPWAPREPDGAAFEAALAVFEAPPGRLRVVMSIEDADGSHIDTDVRDLAIRELRGPVVLGTVEVLRARTARDVRALDANPDAVPVPAREFSRTERLLIRVPAYSSSPDVLQLRGRLLSRIGGAMRDLPVTRRPESDVLQLDLPLAGLAPGEYALEVTAQSGAHEATESVWFRVTP